MYWHTYATKVTAAEDRISLADFIKKYDFEPAEIKDLDIQGFLDHFEVTNDDLYMKSKEEALFLLHGYLLDRSEELYGSNENEAASENLDCIPFLLDKLVQDSYKGFISFENNSLHISSPEDETKSVMCSFSESDRMILLQALDDRAFLQKQEATKIPDMFEQVLCTMIHQVI